MTGSQVLEEGTQSMKEILLQPSLWVISAPRWCSRPRWETAPVAVTCNDHTPMATYLDFFLLCALGMAGKKKKRHHLSEVFNSMPRLVLTSTPLFTVYCSPNLSSPLDCSSLNPDLYIPRIVPGREFTTITIGSTSHVFLLAEKDRNVGRSFIYSDLYNPWKNTYDMGIILFYSWRNWGSEKLSSLLKVTLQQCWSQDYLWSVRWQHLPAAC